MPHLEKELLCPLCLQELGEGEELIVFRSSVKTNNGKQQYRTFDCGQGNFIEEINDFAGEEVNIVADIDRMVFVSHVRCKAENLFWDNNAQVEVSEDDKTNPADTVEADKESEGSQKNVESDISFISGPSPSDDTPQKKSKATRAMVNIPTTGKYEGGRCAIEFNCDKTGQKIGVVVNHSTVRMLRKTAKLLNNHPSMWFPYPLLYAAGRGNFVELIGSKEVGKTILSLQLSQSRSYVSTQQVPFNISVYDYFYLYSKNSFQRELAIRTAWQSDPYSLPMGSESTPGDIRALFVKPATKSLLAKGNEDRKKKAEADRFNKKKKDDDSGFWASVIYPIKSAWERVKRRPDSNNEAEIEEAQTVINKEEMFRPLQEEFYSVIFYDTAGETQNIFPDEMQDVRFHSNRHAVVIDARELFDGGTLKNESIREACQRLESLSSIGGLRAGKKIALIITKLDLVKEQYEESEIREIIETFPATDAEENSLDEKIRTLLRKWLNVHSDDDKQYLMTFIDGGLIDRVFFVWTERLPKMKGIRLSPIREFKPDSGVPGDIVTIFAEEGYFKVMADKEGTSADLTSVKKISFAGQNAEIVGDKTEKEIKVKVPEGAKTGFIEIEIEGINDPDATSRQIFRVVGQSNTCRPKSYGLAHFLAWCLDVKVTDIVNFTSKSRNATGKEDLSNYREEDTEITVRSYN
jgi:hypothetical protein